MQLKKLEVVGFKSFLEKSAFDFTSKVTGVVGPNGCGKSNIVDAIKWVTGELSFKELRGRSTQDLIFSGSELRPPTSMAEVSLTLDNSQGRAPAEYKDYSEINVLRRVFRDGSSEYFINKTPCRLRDIVDIFLDTGVGQSSYSIIEQGRVGMIVASKSDDRRAIIEEAAGITKYKHRKKAAQRKMDYTRQNLLRVNDVLGELKRQINSLERQAKKAERYRKFQDEAKDLDVALSSRGYVALQASLKDKRDEEARLDEQHESEKTELLVKEAQVEEGRLASTEDEKNLQDAQQKLYEQGQEIATLEAQIEGLRREGDQLRNSARSEESRAEAADRKLEEIEKLIEEASSKLLNLEETNISVHGEVEALKAEVEGLEQGLKTLEAEIDDQKQVLMDSVAEEAEVKNQLLTNGERIEEIRRQLESRTREYEESAQEVAVLKEKYTVRQRELGVTVQLRLGFERERGETKERLEHLQEEKIRIEKDLGERHQEIERIGSRLKTLEEFERTYQGYQQGVRSIMERREEFSDDAQLVVGLLGQQLQPERGYEKAVEAALADRIQCLVVNEPESAIKAVHFLKKTDGGRGTFMPRELASHFERKVPENIEGTQGRLLDFVRVTNGCNQSVEALLRSVFVVESLEKAFDVWKEHSEITLVTPEGDLLTRDGMVIGGTWKDEKGVLQIHREIEDLSEQLKYSRGQRELLERNQKRLAHEIATTSAGLQEVETALSREQDNVVHHEKDYERLEDAIERSEQSLKVIEEEQNRLREERRQLEESMARLEARKTEVESKRTSLEACVRERAGHLNAEKEKVSAKHENLTVKKVEQASIVERIESHQRERLSLQAQQTSTREEQRELKEAASRHLEEAEVKIRQITSLDETRTEAIALHQTQQEQVSQLRIEHDSKMAALREQEDALKEIRVSVDAVAKTLNDCRLTIQEEVMKISHLDEQLKERYGISLSELVENEGFEVLSDEEVSETKERLIDLRAKMEKIGNVNLAAIEELQDLKERFEFLSIQKDDLESSLNSLSTAIRKINATTRSRFQDTFEEINTRFQDIFPRLFRGGKAKLTLTDPENLLETGVDILAQPPGKRLQNINLLSGGEKALTAISLLFAIFQYKSPPFCLLDEVDAPLDDANVRRFVNLVKEMSDTTQFILITHNKLSMEIAESLYGITMEEPGVSRIVSVQMNEAMEKVQKNSEMAQSVA